MCTTKVVSDGRTLSMHVVTPLMARMFGTWTLVSAVIRLCGAYNLDSVPYARAAGRDVVATAADANAWMVPDNSNNV